MACHKREGKVKCAHYSEQYRNRFYKSFVLHFVSYFILLFVFHSVKTLHNDPKNQNSF